MSVDFGSLLKKKVDDAKRPEAKPAGTYTGTIHSFKFDVSSQKKTPYCKFLINNVQPGADVDADALAKYRSEFPGVIEKWTPDIDFYLTDEAIFMLKEFQESCGIDGTGRSFDETIPEVRNQPVQFVVAVEPYEARDSTMRMGNKIKSISGLKAA